MIVIQGQMDVDLADREAAVGLMRTMQEASGAEDGCITYRFAEDVGQPGRFWVIEAWESADAVAAHSTSAHLAEFRAELRKLRVTGRSLWRHEASSREPM
jgi:quinol monooxygenase YgiN